MGQKTPAALEEMSLQVRDHECLVLVGPSGSGKSTALRIIAGLEQPTSGDVYIGERKVTKLLPRQRSIAMVFQSYALYPHMDVEGNLSFGLRLAGENRAEIAKRVREVSERLDIARLLKRKPRQLSGGQRQRVALGRAIVRRPDVFLMDEPLSNLDAQLRVQTRVELERLHRQINSTVIYVTHDQTEAMTLGDRIVVLRDGQVQQVATPVELYSAPTNAFVAKFIGSPSMNMIPAEVSGEGDQLILIGEGVRLPITKAGRWDLTRGQKVLIGVRPEHVRDGAASARLALPQITCRAEVVEHLGAETLVHVRIGKVLVTGRFGGRYEVRSDSDFVIGIEEESINLFDEESGSNLSRELAAGAEPSAPVLQPVSNAQEAR
ncbi:MAG TPA: ABC transporter ATP-binding protein [Candidatus Acidoferrales bacterium]|nr:ABC transporter ATP-binding protein [Candidatus Acidoferrales bacterium]